MSIQSFVYTRTRFLGNSVEAVMEGNAVLTLGGQRGEQYVFDFPSVFGRGIIIGRLAMEIAGTSTIQCKDSGLMSYLDFKAKVFNFIIYYLFIIFNYICYNIIFIYINYYVYKYTFLFFLYFFGFISFSSVIIIL